MPIRVSVPATSANLGPGYDVWGIALSLRNTFTGNRREGSGPLCTLDFKFSDLVQTTARDSLTGIPQDDNNLVSRAYRHIFEKAGREPVPIHVSCEVNIPIERGLGASSTAILAGMVLANEMLREIWHEAYTVEQLFDFATDIEGHPDNIAPALYGGWVLSVWDEVVNRYKTFQLSLKPPIKIAGIVPHLTLNTEKARSVIADNFPMEVLIAQSARTALLAHLLSLTHWSDHEKENFHLALEDRVHQPQRAAFIPGMFETFVAWRKRGCYGAFLSGAGTTLLGFWDRDMDLANLDLGYELAQRQVASTPLLLEIDRSGLIIEKD